MQYHLMDVLMGNKEKVLMKMRNNPIGWRIEKLELIAEHCGVAVRKRSGGSHVVFDHPAWVELLCVPAKRPIKPIYIKRFVALIELLEKNSEKI
jgi:hypothetical protein